MLYCGEGVPMNTQAWKGHGRDTIGRMRLLFFVDFSRIFGRLFHGKFVKNPLNYSILAL